VLRADRCIAYNGIEARVPFLDHRFVELYLSLPTDKRVPKQVSEQVNFCHKLGGRKVEKWLLRMSFLDNYLPEEVLWRKKEAFSDGVSSQKKSLFKIIQDNVENMFVDEDFNNDDVNYNIKCSTKEALYYRTIFNKHFDKYVGKGIVPHIWLPLWCGNITDPSARVLKVYE
jgi:asparagine synthase (glutamine-hydrolysing)